MITAILGLFTSSGFGALIGLFGSWLTKKEEAKAAKMKYEYEAKLAEIRKQEAEIEFKYQVQLIDKKIDLAETEGETQQEIANTEAFKESLKEQSRIYKSVFVEALRGIMRPAITIYLLIIATIITVKIGGFIGGMKISLTFEEMLILYKEIIMQILFLTTTSITWWFGSRPSSQRKR